MNKEQLIEAMAKDTKLSKAACERALNSVLKNILKAVKKEPVQLVGFGTFRTIKTKARKGIHHRPGSLLKSLLEKLSGLNPAGSQGIKFSFCCFYFGTAQNQSYSLPYYL